MEKNNWIDIPGFEEHYSINVEGQIRSKSRLIERTGKSRGKYHFIKSRILRPGIIRGYYAVALFNNRKQFMKYIHRLVAEIFIPNPKNNPHINHKNGDRIDNRIENLEWVTSRENTWHGGVCKNTSSKYRGASLIRLSKGKTIWRSSIYINGERKSLGRFATEEDASNAYKKAIIDNNISANKYCVTP